jgi:hypothetical protein
VQSTVFVQNSPNLWRTCGISKIMQLAWDSTTFRVEIFLHSTPRFRLSQRGFTDSRATPGVFGEILQRDLLRLDCDLIAAWSQLDALLLLSS